MIEEMMKALILQKAIERSKDFIVCIKEMESFPTHLLEVEIQMLQAEIQDEKTPFEAKEALKMILKIHREYIKIKKLFEDNNIHLNLRYDEIEQKALELRAAQQKQSEQSEQSENVDLGALIKEALENGDITQVTGEQLAAILSGGGPDHGEPGCQCPLCKHETKLPHIELPDYGRMNPN